MRSLNWAEYIILWAACLLLLGLPRPVDAEVPTLARLSYWVPPERRAEFEEAYKEKVVPILKKHSLVESSEQGRTTVDSVFSRLFEVETPAKFTEKQEALRADPALLEVDRTLGATFGTTRPDGRISASFGLYQMSAGSGRSAPAGSGTKVTAGQGRGHWRTYGVTDGLPDLGVRSILQDREGDLWFGMEGGISRYDGQSFKIFTAQDGLAHNKVRSIFQDREGDLWFGTEGGISRYDGQSFKTFTTQDGLAHNNVSSIFQDREGHLWFGTWGGGISRYDGQSFKTFTTQDNLGSKWVMSILQDREGHLWFSTTGGVSRYDGQNFKTFNTQDGLGHNHVGSILQDREGHLWFGTWGGVSRYDGQNFKIFTTQDGLAHNWVHSILQDQEGYLWFGTSGGVSRYAGQEFITFTTEDGLVDNTVYSVSQDREGDLWFGTLLGLSRYDGQSFTTVTTFTTHDGPSSYRTVRSMFRDREGDLWFGTWGGGISRYDGQSFTTVTTQHGPPNFSKMILSFFQDREEHLWFGTFGGGVSRYDGQSFKIFTTQDGLAHNSVHSILQDQEGDLWFGTQGGVSRYDGQAFKTFTTQDGLGHNHVTSILQDREEHLWFGTSAGVVSRYDGQVFQTLTHQDGLTGHGVLALFQDQEGDLWITTREGVTRHRPAEPLPPSVFIDAVLADRRYEGISELAFPSTVGLTVFEFHGTNFKTRPNGMVYRYRLTGYDEDWQNTYKRRVEYEGLPRGNYTFEVEAVDRDLVYSEAPARLDLEIYYQSEFSSLTLSELHIEDLFASFYQTYAQQPIGSVRVSNHAPGPMLATLSLNLPGLMTRPFELPLELPADSSQYVAFRPRLDPNILDLEEPTLVQAEVSLSFASGEKTLSVVEPPKEITVYGRGALRWNRGVARAAAFITPSNAQVEAFAGPTLAAFDAEIQALGKPGRHLLRALVLFEALKKHGVRYIPDANNPYAQRVVDQSAVDDIQYPAEVLHNKAGDCDDLTALYCALLESAGVATALVDYPKHIFLLFDTGVERQQAYRLPVDKSLYIERGDRLWIPLEVTLLNQSFQQAWHTGAEEWTKLSDSDRRDRAVDTKRAWEVFPPASPSFAEKVVAPERTAFEARVQAEYNELKDRIDEYIDTAYLDRLAAEPHNDALRLQLIQLYCALWQYDTAISTATSYLVDEVGDEAATYNELGIARFLKGEVTQAVLDFRDALKLRPEDKELQGNLELAMEKLGKGEGPARERIDGTGGAGQVKGATEEMGVDDFYWVK